MTTDFSGWSEKRYLRWLLKNYPDPKTRWVQVTLNAHVTPGIFEFMMSDTYLKCICELAYELTMADGLNQQQLAILIQPTRRRKKKQMWMRIKSQSDMPFLGEP